MFVQRNGSGQIIGAYACMQVGYAEEELPDNHPDVIAYSNRTPTPDNLESYALRALNGSADKVLKLIKAVVISNLAFRLGKPPSQLTQTELTNERQRIATIYKNL